MNQAQMRAELIKVYSGPKWQCKVDKMSEKQVVAVYLRMQRADVFAKRHRIEMR